MTARKADSGQQEARKALSLNKRTLKDLSVRHEGPNGGFIMRDTIIIRTGGVVARGLDDNLKAGG